MNTDFEKLVEMITQEVVKTLSDGEKGCVSSNPEGEKALLVGCGKDIPLEARNKYNILPIENYNGDISEFDAVIIGSLSFTQLADIAQGRNTERESCAVLKALLTGKKVFILETGLPHRQYAETASRKLFKMYEGYVNEILSFGVSMIRKDSKVNSNCNAFADNTADKVITESVARILVEKEESTIKLCKGTILTPSAKDIFNHSDKTVEFI